MPVQTKAEIQAENDRLKERYAGLLRQHESFKERVQQEAVRVAGEQGWCDDGLRESLSNLGLDMPEAEYEITFVVEFTITGTTQQSEVTESFVQDSIDGLDSVGLDSDWETSDFANAEVQSVTYEKIG